ncbi:MAG: creatininase family protein [Gemmatimonadota bacterium]|nr:creatininase family protein [Gemmatimonadota bacterium]
MDNECSRAVDGSAWGHATWTELADLGLGPRPTPPHGFPVVAILPVGAVEAHGPHLPLVTDVIIAAAAAKAALPGLRRLGLHPILLPPLHYTAAPFAAGFPGTISVSPATISALLADVAASLERQGVAALVVVNAHLDPAHLGAIGEVVRGGADEDRASALVETDAGGSGAGGQPGTAPSASRPMPVIHPDLTERRWARRLTDEFRSGACHAGCYETSVVMAAAPELVRDAARRGLAANPASLSRAIRAGAATFEEAGVDETYCGDPASATAREGEETVAALAAIVVEAVEERLGRGGGG